VLPPSLSALRLLGGAFLDGTAVQAALLFWLTPRFW
jgi:hypothetical protein